MKPKLELKVDIALNEMLKKFPGGENFFVANNGHIREKNFSKEATKTTSTQTINPKLHTTLIKPPKPPTQLISQPITKLTTHIKHTLGHHPQIQQHSQPTACLIPPHLGSPYPHYLACSQVPHIITPLMHPVASFPSMSSSSSYTMPSQHPVPMSSAPFIFTGAPQYNPLLNHSDLPVNQSSYQTSQSSQLTSSTDTATLAQQPMSSQSVSSQPDHQPVVSASSSPGHQQNAVSEE